MAIYQYDILLIPKSPEVLTYDFGKDQEFEFWDYNFWKNSHSYSEVQSELESRLPFIEWSKNYSGLRNLGDDETNDISISLINDLFIEHFHVRIDLREIDQNFIDLICNIANQLDCYLLDRKGRFFLPNIEDLKMSISESNAFKFISDPSAFFDSLGKGDISLE